MMTEPFLRDKIATLVSIDDETVSRNNVELNSVQEVDSRMLMLKLGGLSGSIAKDSSEEFRDICISLIVMLRDSEVLSTNVSLNVVF